MINYDKILEDCFWDFDFTSDDIKKLAVGSIQEKSFLFQKILLNSTMLFNAMKVFIKDDIKYFIDNYTIPKFNYEYIAKRKNMIEVYFFNKPLLIDELKWLI